MHDHAQAHLAVARVVAVSAQFFAQVSFDHRHHRFDLPALRVATPASAAFRPQAVRHSLSVAAGEGLASFGGPAVFGGHEALDAVEVAGELVVRLRVEACVGDELGERDGARAAGQQRFEFVDVGPRADGGECGKDEMRAAVGQGGELGIAGVGSGLIQRVFGVFLTTGLAADEVGAAVAGLESGGVGGGDWDVGAARRSAAARCGGGEGDLK